MGKRSRMLRSFSLGAGSPLDKIFCRDPANAWEVKSALAPPPSPPPANPAVIDRPSPPPSPPPHGETDLEVVDALPATPKTMIASPRAPIHSEARKEAPEGSPTSPVIFSVEASCQEPSAEDFVPKKPEELFESCFFCEKVLEANEPIYMFG
ncbi:putative WAS/WASL-interacting protein family member 1 [Cocos nucifera]|uniref:Putative WAS/WASL-interacting protein family member 1 n=1 Tax=Cocos nucifera TaxID=13894 RepID=A0A8K0I2D5_COCNU|nr:putative WAS/WASL-interacting protein family member 1 [Cocos nucifera]